MERKSFRINTKVNESNNIQIQLKQKYHTLDILSLKITDNEIYQSTSSDWGVIVGRINGNGGVGIPNVKVSVFIPLDDEDATNPEVLSIYPFLRVEDVDNVGKRYNLLPRSKILDIFSGWITNPFGIGYKPKTAVGTFPNRDDILSNNTVLKVYKKYYRYVTKTNESGDFMLFGVPVGQQTLHIDADLTDIGRYSMSPLVLQKKANKSPEDFSDDGTKILNKNDLGELPNVESQNIVVNVIPFWGDPDTQEIGITRKDFKLKTEIIPSFSIIGSAFTMGSNAYWGDKVVFRLYIGLAAFCLRFSVLGVGINIKINGIVPVFKLIPTPFTTYPDTINGGINDEEPFIVRLLDRSFRSVCSGDVSSEIKCGRGSEITNKLELQYHQNGRIDFNVIRYKTNGDIDDVDDLEVVGDNDIINISDEGQFAMTLFCNRDKKVTDEFGNLVPSTNSDGIFTTFTGYFLAEMQAPIDSPPTNHSANRVKLKIPQSNTPSYTGNNTNWIKESFTFQFGEIYSVAQYFFNKVGTNQQCLEPNAEQWGDNVGLIINVHEEGMVGNNLISNVSNYGLEQPNVFRDEWLNFCLYFPQFLYKNKKNKSKSKVTDVFMKKNLLFDNSIPIGGGLFNTKFFIDGANYKTDFIKIDKSDFINILNSACDVKGFRDVELTTPLKGNYKTNSGTKYFFRGLKRADCIIFSINKGIVQ